ncbi:MAG: ribulose-phosphate 3-epimerase [Bacteroidetes bacterium HGW-Bacteroidetes-21]|jgi:ribulose-phosphate 3-epimerase|nr:MAG: ribulose-phosphate 3-epimerase [Bacteroidetes bacterium HGW-Bacteroidetes-21]
MRIVAPSLLSADFANLSRDIEMLNQSSAQWIHLDIMDGVFVPNISFGFPVVKSIIGLTKKVLDAHLMIVEPDKYVEAFAAAGVNVLTVHYEACPHLHRSLQHIHHHKMKAGVALNPHTPVHMLEEILPYADMVLIMSVNPGFGGQEFIKTSLDKIRKLRKMADVSNPSLLIQVDGGVNENNARELFDAGANVLVAGNAVFKSSNPAETIDKILKA